MSEEKRNPLEELCHKLDELGVEYDTYELPNGNHGVSWIDGNDIEWEAVPTGENFEIHALQLVTPEQAIAATVGRLKVKKVRGMTYDEHGGEVYYLACSGCGEWIDGDLDCISELDGPNFCPNCGGEFDGPLLCKRCGGLADLEYGDMCVECYEEEAE